MTPAVMVQGAGSNVGKSLLVAGLCRLFARRGLKVRPFKPQNMSNNAGVTIEGGEIGRAQVLQARACFTPPSVDMNPVLLKPETDTGAQVIVQGKRVGTMDARAYGAQKSELLPRVLESYHRLAAEADLVIVEGAGSPAEVNLRMGDIANMGFAEAVDMPVILVGDIDRGGVIAALVGTAQVLEEADRERIKGFIINKFRGDVSLFDDGMAAIIDATSWAGLGIVPWFDGARILPAEDILDLDNNDDADMAGDGRYHIAVPILQRIANFDDLDPLRADPNIRVSLIKAGAPLPMDADLVLLLGSKSTIADLAFLREQGWDIDMQALMRQGVRLMGLCGGYQMLGKIIRDPEGLEGRAGSVEGLGFLDVETTLKAKKSVGFVRGVEMNTGASVAGYEIHLGVSIGADTGRPMVRLEDGRDDGAMAENGQVMGCYVHGIFASDAFRNAWLAGVCGEGSARGSGLQFEAAVEEALDALATHLETHIDIDGVERIAALKG